MMIAENPAVASSARPLPFVMRRDLVIREMRMRGRVLWVVKDPVAMRYYQLRDEEHFVLRQLDGGTSSDEIQARFERRYAPRQLETPRLHAFLARLHREGMIISRSPGQGEALLERCNKLARQGWIEALSNVLALRFRGIDPSRFLNWLAPLFGWMFSWWFVAASFVFMAAALTLVVVHFGTLRQRLPDFQAFFGAGNLLWLAAAVALAKVLHELGHALTCRRFGGQCHELGVMLLVFTPCLYCNVSDAWLMTNKWRRIAVGAAGMWVEMMLASAATFVWWWTGPGLLNGLCLDLMFVCSVSTLMFNGNPLLRYDGYYILSDLVEVPNLQEQSSRVVRRWLARWLLDVELPPDRLAPDHGQGWLALYAIASTAYRLVVVVAILWFLERLLRPYGLDALARAIVVMAVAGMVAMPVVRSARWIVNRQRSEPLNWGRFVVRGGLIGLGIGVFVLIPFPHHLSVPAIVEPEGAAHVYVTAPGTLVEVAAAGERVRAGQTIARLENLDGDLELTRLEGERNRQALHVANLRREQGADPAAAAQIPTAEQALADVETRLAERRRDHQRLTLTAPQEGIVLPPHKLPRTTAAGELPNWTDTPLNPRNRGAFFETGTVVCLIGDPGRLEATLVIDQSNIDLVCIGQKVQIHLDELPGETLDGTISTIGELDLKVAPRELVIAGDLPSRIDDSGVPRPLSASYQARVKLDPATHVALRAGAPGRAKIIADPQSLASRLLRYLQQTFALKN
jgi:putative peptide zinc metalloprotease protein